MHSVFEAWSFLLWLFDGDVVQMSLGVCGLLLFGLFFTLPKFGDWMVERFKKK